jgi:hypothetical protein
MLPSIIGAMLGNNNLVGCWITTYVVRISLLSRLELRCFPNLLGKPHNLRLAKKPGLSFCDEK